VLFLKVHLYPLVLVARIWGTDKKKLRSANVSSNMPARRRRMVDPHFLVETAWCFVSARAAGATKLWLTSFEIAEHYRVRGADMP
jgi:hypothetical protein